MSAISVNPADSSARFAAMAFCLALVLLTSRTAFSQQDTMTFDELTQAAEQWANENLDEDALRVLKSSDRERVRKILDGIQKQFQGEYVVDMAALKTSARNILPLLESYEETAPYAIWLKAQLDYLDVADQLRLVIPPPTQIPGQPPAPPSNPAPQIVREVWVKKLSNEPWPKPAKEFVPHLKPLFKAQKVPEELVWMAEVESSFDPRARSPAGAAGLFQLMPDTAKRFGLRTGWPFDDRLKPDPSATAAAKYLHYLHDHFKDWRLALAAYNSGEGTVDKILQRRKAHTYDAIASKLPAETQMYVPRTEAVILRREGKKLSELP